MTEQEQTTDAQLHAEAVQTVKQAEADIEKIIERAEVKSAFGVANGDDDINGAKNDAVQVIADAREEARQIAEQAIEKVSTLMQQADDPAEAQRLTAILHAASEKPRSGIRFSGKLAATQDHEVEGVEAAALQTEAALNAVLLPFFNELEDDLEEISNPPSEQDAAAHDHALHSDTVALPRVGQITIPGGLYTVVFGVLAVVTVIEVILAESPIPNVIAFPLLAALSIGKAVLVVLYYMHLKEDSRIFAWAFGLPLAMAAMIIIFLLIMNPFTY